MAAYFWPLTLPQNPLKGFTEDVGVNILRTPMDSGVAKVRRRGTKPNILNLSFVMSSSQVETLENFVKNTLRGISRFDFPNPRKLGTTIETRIVPQDSGTLFKLQYYGPGYWTVSMTLEVMP